MRGYIRTLLIALLLVLTLGLGRQPPGVQAADPVDDRATTIEDTPVDIHVLANDVDDRLDLVFANFAQRNRFCAGDGAGNFTCSDVSSTDIGAHRDVALGDLNGDGRLDAVFANGGRNRFCAGDGAGVFTCSDVSTDENDSHGVAVGDLNNDGALDLVFANSAQENRFCAGDGAGGFTCSDIVSTDTRDSRDVALGDLNGDGNLDAVLANFIERNRFCAGNGTGGFTCIDVSTDTNSSYGVALGYLNGDGNLDAVLANLGQRNRFCAGNGTGGFTCDDVNTDTNSSYGVALGYVDGDGNLDAVFANDCTGGTQRNKFCAGDGAGGFICSDVGTDANFSVDVVLGDLNSDSNLDAVFANGASKQNRLCAGDGLGGFTCDDVSPDTNSTEGVALGYVGVDASTLAVTVPPTNGLALVNPGGTIIYTPNPGFSHGTDTFTYAVEGATATVTVVVGPVYIPIVFKNYPS